MKRLAKCISVFGIAVALFSCTTISPNYGIATDARMDKTGEASGTFLFGMIPLMSADISVSTAAKNAGIKRISTVDSKKFSVLGIVVVKTTIVTGEGGESVRENLSAPVKNEHIISISELQNVEKTEDEIKICNATTENYLEVSVSIQSNGVWKNKGSVNLNRVNSLESFQIDKALAKADAIRIASNAKLPYSVKMMVIDDDLCIWLVSAESENNEIDFEFDVQTIDGTFKDNVKIKNETGTKGASFDVFAKETETDDWKKIGTACLSGTDTVHAFEEDLSHYRYFALSTHGGENYTYSVKKSNNDVIISVLPKKE